MKKVELIGRQQLQIERLKAENLALYERCINIHKMLTCVGGPLNDNKHEFSREQLQIFFEIASEVNDINQPEEE